MSANSKIYNALLADSSISFYVGTNVYESILPNNHDVSTNNLVYESRIIDVVNTLSERDIVQVYNFTVKIVSTSTLNIEALNVDVRRTMLAISDSNIQDVLFERDNDVFDEENELYTDSLDFTVWYYP